MGAEQEQSGAAGAGAGDREPLSPAIQPFGFLIALNADWLVLHASANCRQHIGIPHEQILGKPLREFFIRETVHAIRNRMMLLREADAVERLSSIALREDRPPYDAAVHFSGPSIIIEAEPATANEGEAASMVRSMIARLRKAATAAALLAEGARYLRAMTGFDRVALHRFDGIGNGAVAAEAVRPGIGSMLGFSYPASDISSGAHELDRRNALRIIADIDVAPVPIVADRAIPVASLDPSLCILRAASPAERGHLRSVGAAASLSAPVVIDGIFWGLFVCHHGRARLPSFAQRSAVELFVQIFSLMLESRQYAEAAAGRR